MAWPSTSTSALQIVDQVHVPESIAAEHVAFCDAHDLVAVITTGNTPESAVTVYRLKGEVAFTIALQDDEDLRPSSLQWKPDGSLLAVTWSDEVCCLYSGENGKLLYELPTRRAVSADDANWTLDVNAQDSRRDNSDAAESGTESAAVPAPMTWTSYDDGEKRGHERRHNNDDITTDDFFDVMNGSRANETKPSPERSDSAVSDLVNALTTLDTTSVLPRLSKIETPSGMRYSPEGNKFSTQASTDTIFDASTFAPGIFSTLLTSDTQGCITVFFDETIKVGHIQLSSSEQVKSASRRGCSSQVIVTRNQETHDLYQLNFVDLPLERLGSPLNYVVSLNTRRLQSLMTYITHTVRCIHQEIQTGIKGVPMRLMKLLEEDLRSASADSAAEPTDIVTIELQHLALTSNFNPVVLEWLKDIVKETGHKRWDQATNSMYDHIQSYIFKNLLPAVQRFVAAVSALRGQARFHQHTGKLAITLEKCDDLIEWADTLSVVAQRTLHAVTEEQTLFKAFSKWLRVMIDVAVAGPGSKGADETEEREAPNYDMDLCLRYISGPLMESLLKLMAESTPPGQGSLSKEDFFGHPIVTSLSRDRMLAALEKLDAPERGTARLEPRSKGDSAPHPSDPVNLPLLTCLLNAHARIAIEEINHWQAQAVPRSPDVVPLEGMIDGHVRDMTVHPSSPSASDNDAKEVVHVLRGSHGSLSLLHVRRQKAKNTPPRLQVDRLGLPSFGTPAGGSETATIILHASLLPREHGVHVLVLAQAQQSDDYALFLLRNLSTPSDWQPLHTWNPSTAFLPSPTHFVIGGRPGKRVVVVFSPAGRGTRWEALDLEGAVSRGDDEGVFARAEGDVEME